jgi:electron transfer flavoprotein beta subunit
VINIIVCMKQVMDPEAPLSLFHIDTETKQAILPKSTPPVLSPFDENALEAALKIKDKQEAKVTVVSLGRKLTRAIVKSPLAAGADQLILIEDDAFGNVDTSFTANALALAIKKLGSYDLILCGMQASDTNAGQVGPGIAHILGIPGITLARKVEFINGKIKVERALPEGYEVLEVTAPAVVTTNYEVGVLREPGVEAFMAANKKPITVWNAQQLGLDMSQKSSVNLLKLFQPVREGKCEMVEGATPEEKAGKLAARLREVKII